MKNIFIDLNRWYNKYKKIIWIIISVVILFLLVSNSMDKMSVELGNSSNSNITTISQTSEKNSLEGKINNIIQNEELSKDITNVEESIKSNEDAIKAFIILCNNGKTNLAYNMLSNDCKNIVYPTEQQFIKSYYNVIFKTYKNVDIVGFKNNTYKVNFLETAITTGENKSMKNMDYITVVGGKKINISNFICKEKVEKSNKNQYVEINVEQRIIYWNYEEYVIKAKNLTNVDMYVNNINASNLFIKSEKGIKYDISNEENSQNIYYIPANSEKEIKLKFYRDYQPDNDVASINFESIKIENKIYYDSNTINSNVNNGNSQDIVYQQKSTNYPENLKLNIKL